MSLFTMLLYGLSRNPEGFMVSSIKKAQKDGIFKPSKKDVRVWYGFLNQLIFNGEVPPFRDVVFWPARRYFAECHCRSDDEGFRWCDLRMAKTFESFDLFLTVLAHEMVHNHNWNIDKVSKVGHGKHFNKWKEKFALHNIPLAERY